MKTIHVVPHSHWDREWYFTLAESNVLLIENVDYLLSVLENNDDFPAYVFDGQVSVIDEYLRVRPENTERIKQLVRGKRLFIGPWYTQTDTLLVHAETMIRNLLYGTKRAQEYGHSMNIGYLPDVFGQNAYLPSIFADFGIEYAVLQRGLYKKQLQNGLNFVWQSPDGKSVKTNNICLGYGVGKFIDSDKEYYHKTLLPLLQKIERFSQEKEDLLLPSGGDQMLVRAQLLQIVQKLNDLQNDYMFILSDYENFMSAVWGAELRNDKVIAGELLAEEQSRVHHTIASQRYDIKQKNSELEYYITRILEPLAVIGQSCGLKYPDRMLDGVWQEFFDVHAHDSLGGCNSDATNDEIVARLQRLKRTCVAMANVMQKQLARGVVSGAAGQESVLLLSHLGIRSYSGVIESTLFVRTPHFELHGADGKAVEYEISESEKLSGGHRIAVTAAGEEKIALPTYYKVTILIKLRDLPALGYTVLQVKEKQRPDTVTESAVGPLTDDSESPQSVANEFYRVEIIAGRLLLHNKTTGECIEDFFIFEDSADTGDSYDYSPLPGEQVIRQSTCRLISCQKGLNRQKMLLEHELRLPLTLTERGKVNDRQETTVAVRTEIELTAGCDFVNIRHSVENSCCDHRLRVMFPLPFADYEKSFAEQGFSLIEREVINHHWQGWRENGFAEAPVAIYPLQNIAGVRGKESVFALLANGIKEYEVLKAENMLALTLFRSVGLLGKDDLVWRPGRASGINNTVVYTTDAQLKKNMDFSYAVYWSNAAGHPADVFRAKERFLLPVLSYHLQDLNSFAQPLDRFLLPQPVNGLPWECSLLRLENESIFVSAVKQSWDKNSLILRLYNPTEERQSGCIISAELMMVRCSNLAEDEGEEVRAFAIEPFSYLTLRVKRQGRGVVNALINNSEE